MEAIPIGSNPDFYFQVGKIKISEGMKWLQDLVVWYKDNLTPGNAGILDATMVYLQSLQQEVESLAQKGKVLVSSNDNGTNLQHGQEITQMREQNAYFGPTLNQETEMVINPNIESTSRAKKKRKLKSKVWEDFTKYEGIDGNELAKCRHCKKDFVGSSKSGTTHLKNHLKSCQGLRNPGGVVDKEKEKSLIDPALNGSDMVLKIIKYGLNSIKNDILDVYKQEKDRLNRYLHKVPSRFNVKIEQDWESGLWFIVCWFIDDSWKLQNIVSLLGKHLDYEIVMSWLVDQNIDKKICSMTRHDFSGESEREQFSEKINHSFNERGPLPFIGNFLSFDSLLYDLRKEIFDLGRAEYKTANVYFPRVCEVVLKIVQLGKSENHYYWHIEARFREILERYWDEFNFVLVIPTILDPRFKMDVVKKFYQEFYDDPVYLDKIIVEVTHIYSKYAKYAESTNDDIVISESELDRYLRDSKCPPTEGFDILEWWHGNSPTYPIMAKIAHDFLSIPINNFILPASYAYDLCLDEINDIYDCNCVDADLKQALACTKIWLYNK